MATLKIFYKNQLLDSFLLGTGKKYLIGRDTASEVVIDEMIVSFHHAKIESHVKGFLLIDLDSTNGTFVNGKRTDAIWLNDGDKIAVGNHTLIFSSPLIRDVCNELQKLSKDTISMNFGALKRCQPKVDPNIPRELDLKNKSSMVLVQLPGHNNVVPLMENTITLGKKSTSDIVVKNFGVGKIAAIIEKLADGWYLRYVGGYTRPRVNGEFPKKPIRLKEFDIISLGKTKMQILVKKRQIFEPFTSEMRPNKCQSDDHLQNAAGVTWSIDIEG